MSDVDVEALDRALQRSLDNPIPRDLKRRIADEIEPHTMNSYLDHGEVMTAIQIAYPLIRDYLAEHGESL